MSYRTWDDERRGAERPFEREGDRYEDDRSGRFSQRGRERMSYDERGFDRGSYARRHGFYGDPTVDAPGLHRPDSADRRGEFGDYGDPRRGRGDEDPRWSRSRFEDYAQESGGRPQWSRSSRYEGQDDSTFGSYGDRFDRDSRRGMRDQGRAQFGGDPSRYGRESSGYGRESSPFAQDFPYAGEARSAGRDSSRFGSESSYDSRSSSSSNRSASSSDRSGFAGKGPKNYRRSDERIREDVCEALKLQNDLDASDIDVEVKQGSVTLKGEVSERRDKRRAEDCCENVSGVDDVTNQLRVRGANARDEQRASGGSTSQSETRGGSSSNQLQPVKSGRNAQ